MGLTRQQLEDRCLQFGYGEQDRPRFTDFLNQAYRDVLSRHRWSWNRSVQTLTSTAGQNTITLDDAAYIYFGRLRPLTADVAVPKFVEWDNKDYATFTRESWDATNRGTPTKYTILTDSLIFNVYFDRVVQYEANYWPLPTYMTAGSSESVLPDEDREVLTYGALMYQCMRDKDWQGVKFYNEMYEGKITEMWTKDRTNSKDGTSRVRMPDHYFGLFD